MSSSSSIESFERPQPAAESMMSIRNAVIAQITDIAGQQGKELAPLTDDLPLVDSGLDSLCIALIVAGLEDDLGFDPLSSDEQHGFPVTIGDFIGLYERAAG